MHPNARFGVPAFPRPCWTLLATFLAVAASPCRADFKTMAQRLPAESDTVVAVNLVKVLETPYARQHKWAENIGDAWAKKPVMIPPGSVRVLMAAGMRPSTMESAWELSLVEMTAVPPLDALAGGEGGHIDRVWDRNAVVSPVNAYFIPMDNNVLASITPAERQMVTRWVRTPAKPDLNLKSAYLREIVSTLNDDTHVMMAIDLEGAVSAPKAHKAMIESGLRELEGKNLDALANALSSLRGASLSVRVGERLMAYAAFDFDKEPAPLAPVAPVLTAAVLERVGLPLPDVAGWKYQVSGKQITATGELSDSTLRLLLGLVQTPVPGATVATASPAGASAGTTAASGAPLDPAQASLRYYKTVSGIVDTLGQATSASAAATSLRQSAKRIDQLPILNVDPMLLEWGALVSSRLKQAAGVGAVTQSNVTARASNEQANEYGSYSYDNYGNYQSGTWVQVERNAANARARAAGAEQRAEGQKQIAGMVADLSAARSQVRAKMVAKYKIEF